MIRLNGHTINKSINVGSMIYFVFKIYRHILKFDIKIVFMYNILFGF